MTQRAATDARPLTPSPANGRANGVLGYSNDIDAQRPGGPLRPDLVGIPFKSAEVVDGHGYLYVIAFSTGVIKVGQTINPRRRLVEHRRNARAFGVTVVDKWLSVPHVDFLVTEAQLISGCAVWSKRSKREYFHEIGWGEAIEFAQMLATESVQGVSR